MSENTLKIGSFVGPHPTSLKPSDWVDSMKEWPRTEAPQITVYLLQSKACDLKEMSAFRSLDSYNYLKSGWVGEVLIHKPTAGICYLRGSVTPSQALSEEPHSAWVCVRTEGEILSTGCTCMAGLGRACSHAAAILWKIDQANRKGLTTSSCTDECMKWNRGTKRNLEPSLIQDLTFKKPKKEDASTEEVHSEEKCTFTQCYDHVSQLDHFRNEGFEQLINIPGTILNFISSVQINAEIPVNSISSQVIENQILTHVHDQIENLPYSCSICSDFYSDFITLTPQQINQLENQTVSQSSSELWIESRKLRITASTAAKVPKTSKGDPLKYLFRHIYRPFQGNGYTKRGSMCEPLALKQFAAKSGLHVKTSGTKVSKIHPWLSASPDGLIGTDSILEIKCPDPDKFSLKNADVTFVDEELKLNPKGTRGYYVQVQITMFCAGRRNCFFYVWISPDQDYVVRVPYDEEFMEKLLERLRTFYFQHMLPKLVDDFKQNILTVSPLYRSFLNQQ